jgi:hypothetical protein
MRGKGSGNRGCGGILARQSKVGLAQVGASWVLRRSSGYNKAAASSDCQTLYHSAGKWGRIKKSSNDKPKGRRGTSKCRTGGNFRLASGSESSPQIGSVLGFLRLESLPARFCNFVGSRGLFYR